jgi:hypothetical protein
MEIILISLERDSLMNKFIYHFGFYGSGNNSLFIINSDKPLLFDHNSIMPFDLFIDMYQKELGNPDKDCDNCDSGKIELSKICCSCGKEY